MTTQLFDGKNNHIGKLVESGGQIRVFDLKGQLKGYYDKNSDRTINAQNALFCKGNRVTALLN